jgi:site-specific recombinase XerD
MRITLDGKRFELSTHRRIIPSSWDKKLGYVHGTNDEAVILNNYLDSLKSKVLRQFNILESLGEEVSIDTLKGKLNGTSEKRHTLLEVFNYHNDQFFQRIGTDYSIGTFKHYKVTLGKVKAFLQYQYKKSDYLLDDLKFQFITSFELYLKTQDHISHNSAIKHIIRLKKIINMAIANEWLQRNPFSNFKCTYKETNRGYLTQEELDKLEEKIFPVKRLELIRDIFVFQCYTGLAYSDVEKLTPDDINTGIDGEKWIIIYRKKTGERSPIPLLPKALQIIEKYKDYPVNKSTGKLLPVKSNQRMNAYLKEIADLCGITKNFSTHLARHTFATTVTLANSVPIETVSKMLGHSSIRTTQIYSKVVDTKVSIDMQKLKTKLSDSTKLKKVI